MSLCTGVHEKNVRHFIIEDYRGCYEDLYTETVISNTSFCDAIDNICDK